MRNTVPFGPSTPPVQLAGSVGELYRPARQYTKGPRAMLMKASSQSLTEQLSARIAQRIRDRLLAPGARLPSVRKVTYTRALQEFSLLYGEPRGDSGLRRVLSQKLSTLNIHAAPENIITTVGATHERDIESRTLQRPRDHLKIEK